MHRPTQEKNLKTDRISTIPTNWNLEALYSSPKDPKIKKDLKKIECLCVKFQTEYSDTSSWIKKDQTLLRALKAYERLLTHILDPKPLAYASLKNALNAEDEDTQALLSRVSATLTDAQNNILFFELELGSILQKRQEKILSQKEFSNFWYLLARVWKEAKYQLTEKEECILALKELPARDMWILAGSRERVGMTISFKGENIPLAEANNLISSLKTKDRHLLHSKIMHALKEKRVFAEAEINAVVTDKKITDDLREFTKPYSETILRYQNNERSVESLVSTVLKNNHLSHRFYALKKDLLGVNHLTYADRGAKVGTVSRSFSFEESVSLLRETLQTLPGPYEELFNTLVKEGRIDAFPQKGKEGGAFQASFQSPGVGLYILLNHTNSFTGFTTLAHEVGHALHSLRSLESQPTLYKKYTISAAECASTFFEGVVFSNILSTLSRKDKIIALHDKIQNSISSIHRQIAFFAFERELHEIIRKEGYVSAPRIAEMLNTHMMHYLGDAFTLEPNDGYFFVQVGHIRRPFYVYSYAYGTLASQALIARFEKDPTYIKEIDSFLSAGSSKSPDDIFASIGLNTASPAFYASGLRRLEKEIAELETLL